MRISPDTSSLARQPNALDIQKSKILYNDEWGAQVAEHEQHTEVGTLRSLTT